MAGTKGNTNSSKANRLWADTIRRVVAQGDAEKLRRIAEKLVAKAEEGDMAAIKELGDRLDGKPNQQVDIEANATLTVEVVRFADSPSE